jgi:hypothetical protein
VRRRGRFNRIQPNASATLGNDRVTLVHSDAVQLDIGRRDVSDWSPRYGAHSWVIVLMRFSPCRPTPPSPMLRPVSVSMSESADWISVRANVLGLEEASLGSASNRVAGRLWDTYCGKFTRRTRSAKRGSEHKLFEIDHQIIAFLETPSTRLSTNWHQNLCVSCWRHRQFPMPSAVGRIERRSCDRPRKQDSEL